MGRAVVRDPSVFLFDEPLSNLDLGCVCRCAQVNSYIRSASAVYVTHDQVEAMTLADRVVVLNKEIPSTGWVAHGTVRQPANLRCSDSPP
jgi:ABC-type sugar transport system ATPase subunit